MEINETNVGINEELLGDETPYLSAIGALMYLAKNTRRDICFAVSLLARSVPPQQKDIGMVLNTYFYIFGGPWTWVYSIPIIPSQN